MRRRGTGTINPTPDGRFRPRLPGQNGAWLPACATEEDAAVLLDAALIRIANGASRDGDKTVSAFGLDVIDTRELHGLRDSKSERSRWKTHVAGSVIGAKNICEVTRRDVLEWRDELLAKKAAKGNGYASTPDRKLSRSTVQSTINLMRAVLAVAVDKELIEANPAFDVQLPRSKGVSFEPWTYLLPDEQSALLTCQKIPVQQRLMIAFALGTGLREGELYNLELADVHDDHVVIRFGSKGKAPKSGKIRRVPLFGLAAASLAAWLPQIEKQKNEFALLWPTVRGQRRQYGAPPWWESALATAGIVAAKRHDRQRVRWHDLRHSCASSLVAGWWGRRWSLEEVRTLLGHSSITVTERYAHLGDTVLAAAADATSGEIVARSTGRNQSHLRDLNSRPTVYEGAGKMSNINALALGMASSWRARVETLGQRALTALAAISHGGADAYRLPIEVLGELAAWGQVIAPHGADEARTEKRACARRC